MAYEGLNPPSAGGRRPNEPQGHNPQPGGGQKQKKEDTGATETRTEFRPTTGMDIFLETTARRGRAYVRYPGKYKPNQKNKELLGVVDPVVKVSASASGLTASVDTTIKADAAKLSISNSTGETITVYDFGLKGKPVYRLSGDEGYLHDGHIDYEDIAKNGEKLFELGNNYIAQKELVEKLADYWKKRTFAKLHVYEVELTGTRYYFEPGEWYTLQIGGAGQPEYINSAVECVDLTIQRNRRGIGQTVVIFREVYENWKFDSNVLARLLARGDVNRLIPRGNVITVAADDAVRAADVHCDGTADEVEIQYAIDQAANTGSSVQLLRGTYAIAAAIDRKGVHVFGEGPGTVLQTSTDIHMWTNTVAGGSLSEMKLQFTGGTEVEKYLIYETQDNFTAVHLTIDHPGCLGVSLGGNRCKLVQNDFTGGKSNINIEPKTAAEFENADVSYIDVAWLDDTHFVVAYCDEGNSDHGTARIGKIDSSHDITYGTVSTFNAAATSYIAIDKIDSTHFVITYRDEGNSNYGTAIIGTTDGDVTISGYGSEYVFKSSGTTYTEVKALDATHIVIGYISTNCYSLVGVVSNDDEIAYGSEYTVQNTSSSEPQIGILDGTHFAISYYSSNGNVKIGTVTNDDEITYGDADDYVTSPAYTSLAVLDTYTIVVSYSDASNSFCKVGHINSDFDNTDFGEAQQYRSAATEEIDMSSLDSTHFVIVYKDGGNSNYGTAIIGTVYGKDYIAFTPGHVYAEVTADYNSCDGNIIVFRGTDNDGYAQYIDFELPGSYCIKSDGNNNIIGNNTIHGTTGKYVEVGIDSDGDLNTISNNTIEGDGQNREYILHGINIRDDSNNNNVSSNNISGVEKVAVVMQGTNNKVSNIMAKDNGNLIDRGDCESETAPMIEGETTPVLSDATFERQGQAASFNGSSSEMSIPSGLPAGDISISLWFKASKGSGNNQIFLSQENSGGTKRYFYIHNDDTIKFISRRSDGTAEAPSSIPEADWTADTWHHVVGVQDGTTTRIYLDKVLIAEDTHADIYTSFDSDGYLGSTGSSGYYDGLLDDVYIYSDALTASEVSTLYAGTFIDHTNNLISAWCFDGDCYDDYVAGSQHDGTGTDITYVDGPESTWLSYAGSRSWKVRKTVASGTEGYVEIVDARSTSDMHGIIPGLTYKVYCQRWADDTISIGTNHYVSIRQYDYTSADGWTAHVCNSGTTGWAQLAEDADSEVTIEADATGYVLRLQIHSNAGEGSWFLVDEIRLVPMKTHNEHDQSFVDYGTGTQEIGNSWQSPFPA